MVELCDSFRPLSPLGESRLGTVVSLEKILQQRSDWSAKGKRVVFLAGRFDLLHPGHIRLLEQARDLGDIVIVGVFSDDDAGDSVKQTSHSSPNRPVTPASERAEVLAALAAVESAFEIEVDSLVAFLRQFRPDAIVDGAEPAASSPTPLAAAATQLSLNVTRVPLEPGHSSSRLIERITQLRA